MTKIIISLLLITPVFAGAAPAKTEAKINVYQTITDDLLTDCTGVNKTIAVAGFSYSDGHDSRDGGVVAERITTELVKLKKFKVIERKELEKVYAELKFQQSGLVSLDSAKQIGKTLGADWIIVGTLTELPEKQLELNTRLVGIESGEILSASSAQIEKDWLDLYKKLLKERNKIVEKDSKDAQAFYEMGVMYTDLEEFDNAIGSFGIAISLDAVYPGVYSGRGTAYFEKGDNDKAIEDFSKAIAIDPNDVVPYIFRGDAYFKRGEDDKAIEDFSKAIAISPNNFMLYGLRGKAYSKRGEYDKAIENYSKAIAINPNKAGLYGARGNAYYGKGEYDKAIENYSKAIAIDPNDAVQYILRGSAYFKRGEDDKAIEDFSKAIAISPQSADTYNRRGIAYRAKGEYAKAVADEEKHQSLSQK